MAELLDVALVLLLLVLGGFLGVVALTLYKEIKKEKDDKKP